MIFLGFNLAVSLSKKVATNSIRAQPSLSWFRKSNYKIHSYHLLLTECLNSKLKKPTNGVENISIISRFMFHHTSLTYQPPKEPPHKIIFSFLSHASDIELWRVEKKLPKLIKLPVWLFAIWWDVDWDADEKRALMEFRVSLSSFNRRSFRTRFMKSINSHRKEKQDNWVIS